MIGAAMFVSRLFVRTRWYDTRESCTLYRGFTVPLNLSFQDGMLERKNLCFMFNNECSYILLIPPEAKPDHV